MPGTLGWNFGSCGSFAGDAGDGFPRPMDLPREAAWKFSDGCSSTGPNSALRVAAGSGVRVSWMAWTKDSKISSRSNKRWVLLISWSSLLSIRWREISSVVSLAESSSVNLKPLAKRFRMTRIWL